MLDVTSTMVEKALAESPSVQSIKYKKKLCYYITIPLYIYVSIRMKTILIHEDPSHRIESKLEWEYSVSFNILLMDLAFGQN